MQHSTEFHPDPGDQARKDTLARDAASLGRGIVEIAGQMDLIRSGLGEQTRATEALRSGADQMLDANARVAEMVEQIHRRATSSLDRVEQAADTAETGNRNIRALAHWVSDLSRRVEDVSTAVVDVHKSNAAITSIASQVSILALNAKIEAVRAGDAGRGFAVVAEAVKELSHKTRAAAEVIDTQVQALSDWVAALSREAQEQAEAADLVQGSTQTLDEVIGGIARNVRETSDDATLIGDQASAVTAAAEGFQPAFGRILEIIDQTSGAITTTAEQTTSLIDTSERIVQGSVSIGGSGGDEAFIARVRRDAAKMSELLTSAVDTGEISMNDLFTRRYAPVRGSDPAQFLAPFTGLTDRLFAPIQEDALASSDKVIFCAAVADDGYLPTHNRKFSHPQGDDPVWNAAHCRNRRMFDDRVGLKAGRNLEPFLLQVYRRDMGGGEFRVMKDLSAPITVRGRHWGGLRLAYGF